MLWISQVAGIVELHFVFLLLLFSLNGRVWESGDSHFWKGNLIAFEDI